MLSSGAPQNPAFRAAVSELVAIPVLAARLLVRNLPQLITILCLGLAGREIVIWLSIWVSSRSSLLAMLIMPLAPAAVMISMVIAFWLLRHSLTTLGGLTPASKAALAPRQRETQIMSTGALLVPFLTAYASHGMLSDDFTSFRHGATTTEIVNRGFAADTSRSFISDSAVLVAFIIATFVLRRVIEWAPVKSKLNHAFGFVAAYLEILWLTTGSLVITNQVQSWAVKRRSVAPVYDMFHNTSTITSADGRGPIAEILAWLSTYLPALFQFVAVPVSWLTLAVLVLNSVAAPQSTPSGETGGASVKSRSLAQAVYPVVEPFESTWNGLKPLIRSGLVSVAAFCLVFTLANFVEIFMIHLGRAVVGPREVLASEVAASYILVLAKASYLITVICLISSAVSYFTRNSGYLSLDTSPTSSSKKGLDSGSLRVT